MRNILVQLALGAAIPLPTGVTFASRVVTSTDAAGATQKATLTGSETPPWSVTFTSLADGAGSISAQDTDTAGAAIGVAVVQAFPAAGGTGGGTFQPTSAITVTPAP